MVFETGKLKYLVRNGRFSQEELSHLWETLTEQYVSLFGFTQGFKDLFDKQKKLILLKNKYALTKKASLKELIKFRQKELESINPTEKDKENYLSVVMAVEKSLGRSIDEKTVSVRKFYTYLNDLKNGAK